MATLDSAPPFDSPPGRLLDLEKARTEDGGLAAFRREVKYIFPGADPMKLDAVLQGAGRRLVYNKPISRVHSLYFDDHRLSACRENLDGVARRFKTRLRWYDSDMPDGWFFFEIKRREGRLVRKDRWRIRCARPLSEISFREMVEELLLALPPESAALLQARPEPVVLIEYQRRHFEALDAPVRLTLDTDIRCYSQIGRQTPAKQFAMDLEGLSIIECKMPPTDGVDTARLLRPLRPRETRCSKYAQCCGLLGVASGAALEFE